MEKPERSEDDQQVGKSCTDSCIKIDPLGLTDVVVDKILEHADDRTLLTMREVCKSWNAQVTRRSSLWKHRCERKRQFRFDEETKDRFQDYLRFHRMYHRMQTGQAFQTIRYPKERKIIPEKWDPRFLASFKGLRDLDIIDSLKAVVDLYDNRLMVVDLETQQVLWRMDILGLNVIRTKPSNPYILCLTDAGNLVIISLEGERRPEIDCQGKLEYTDGGEMKYGIHPSGRFILFRSYMWEEKDQVVYLVDVKNHTATQLQLNGPDPTQEGLGPEDQGPLTHVGFLPEDSLSEGQLAVGVVSMTFWVAAVITTRGKVLHQACMKRENRRCVCAIPCMHRCNRCSPSLADVMWCEEPFSEFQDLCFVRAAGQHVEKYRVRCEAGRVHFEVDWRKPMQRSYKQCDSMVFGNQFALGQRGHSMQIFRLDSGQLVADLPYVFTNRHGCTHRPHSDSRWMLPQHTSPTFEYHNPETLYRVFECLSQSYKGYMRTPFFQFYNLQWLHGLSAASTKPGVPILTVFHLGINCRSVRWRDDVWMSLEDDVTGQGDDVTRQGDDVTGQ